MYRTITAIDYSEAYDYDDYASFTMLFEVPDENFDLEQAVRDASKYYLNTVDGHYAYHENCEHFDWGAFNENVPNRICKMFGFTKIDSFGTGSVDWDEQLGKPDEELTTDEIREALDAGIIRIEDAPEEADFNEPVCRVKDVWFYFVGEEDENSSASEFKKNYTTDMVAEQLYDVLQDGRHAEDNDLEEEEYWTILEAVKTGLPCWEKLSGSKKAGLS